MSKLISTVSLMVGVMIASAFGWQTAEAKQITSISQAQKKASKEIKNAVITDSDMEIENGETVYEITLLKGTREYEIVYRAKDGKKVQYGWEEKNTAVVDQSKTLSKKECRKLAKKKVKNASVISLTKKMDDGVSIYKVKLKKGNKKYTLTYLVAGKKLIEYEWELTKKSTDNKQYIGTAKAKKIALEKVPGGSITECKFDKDDGVPVYEIEVIKNGYEYEFTIHAKTGKIIEMEKDILD